MDKISGIISCQFNFSALKEYHDYNSRSWIDYSTMWRESVLSREGEIQRCINQGIKFKIDSSVKQLELEIATASAFTSAIYAIQESTSLKYLRIRSTGGSIDGFNKLIYTLASSKTLETLIFHASIADDESLRAVSNLITQNSVLKSLDIGFSSKMNLSIFLRSLAHNAGLQQVTIRKGNMVRMFPSMVSESQALEYLDTITSALSVNPSVSNFTIQAVETGQKVSRENTLRSLDWKILIERKIVEPQQVLNNVSHGEYFFVAPLQVMQPYIAAGINPTNYAIASHQVESELANVVGSFINNSNWEGLAKFINDMCHKNLVGEIYPPDLNLNMKTFVTKLIVHSLKQVIESTSQDSSAIRKLVDESTKLLQSLVTERAELQRRLQLLEYQIPEVDAQLKKNSILLSTKDQSQANLLTNHNNFQTLLGQMEFKLNSWQHKLQTDFSKWSCDDVLLLLDEIGMKRYSTNFAMNKIDGGVLQALDTNDLTTTLQVSFKDAKKLQMYVYLVKAHHNIYVIPPGVLQWNNHSVCMWLQDNKFGHLVDVFQRNQITGAELVFLEKADLTHQLKIQALGDCVRLEKEVAKLKNSLFGGSVLPKNVNNNNNLTQQLEEMKLANEQLNRALKEREMKMPEAFICPITQDVMTDPVVASDGHTYERTAIELWLKTKNTSPMTGLVLLNKQLTPSHTLKSMIREYIDVNKKK